MPGREAGPSRRTVLILGGTGEAAALAAALAAEPGLEVVTSLAGRTRAPAPVAGRVRTGGFGGAEAMAAYLREARVAAVIDATHPFATRISANAAAACAAAGVPRLALARPAWQARPGDDWHEFADARQAAEALPRFGRRAFLTVGRRDLDAFAALADMWFLVRLVDMPEAPLPLAECRVVAARGPFAAADERRLMERHGIDVLVTKASGGPATEGKLAAARALGLPVAVIARPDPPPGPLAGDEAAARTWLAAVLAGALPGS